MITAVIVLVAIYLAVRFTLSEASQKLNKVREIWDQTVCTSQNRHKTKEGNTSRKSSIKNIFRIMDRNCEKSDAVASHARRRTGAVNGKMRRPKIQRLSKSQLRLPFMDTGIYQGNGFASDVESSPINAVKSSTGDQNTRISDHVQAVNHTEVDGNIVNMFKVPTEDRSHSFFTRLFHHVSFILQRNSTVDYPDVSEKVLSSERVKSAIKTAVLEEFKGQEPDDAQLLIAQLSHKQRAMNVLQNMRSCISSFLLKVAAWVMYKLLGRMLDGIEVHKEQIQTIKRASQHDVPIIYLPLHRSHLDYILVTFILYMNDLRAPLVAAGNNLMIPFFGSLLRGLGAFFIKRKLDPQHGQRDFVYRAILHTYMEKSLKDGHSLEFFIEGGRSRTGKAVLPKAGLLSIVVDTLVSGGISDAFIVPIAMSYEKLLDGNFVSEQMGKPKEMENFTSAVRAIWSTLHSNFGTVRVDFCQPFSLKEFLLAAEYSYNLPVKNLHPCIPKLNNCYYNNKEEKHRRRSEYGTEIVIEDHRQVIKDLADYIVYDAFNINALMSTNVLAFLLITKHRKGATFHQLVSSLNWLRDEITKRNKAIGFCGDSAELIKRGSSLLGKELVSVETIQMEWSSGNADNNMQITFYKPSVSLPEVLELQYYANSVLPVFLLESVVINAMFSLMNEEPEKASIKETKSLFRGQILKQSLELCSMLQFEFIFSPPGTSLCTVLSATIDDLISNGLLQAVEDAETDSKENYDAYIMMNVIADGLHQEVFVEEEESDMIQRLKMCPCDDHSSMLPFLKCILSSFIESYWLVSCTLPKLINSEMEEKQLLQEMKKFGQKKIHLGNLYYEECLGLDTLKNALKLFESWKIVKSRIQSSRKMFSLFPMYNNSKSLEDIIARIAKYRR